MPGPDSDLEAFSHNPSDGSLVPLAYQVCVSVSHGLHDDGDGDGDGDGDVDRLRTPPPMSTPSGAHPSS